MPKQPYQQQFIYEEDKIKDYLNNDYRYSVYFIDHNIDVQNYDSPLGMSMMEVSSQLSSSITSNNINLQPLNLKTRRGFMFDETEEINSYHYSQNEKLTYEKDKGELLTVTTSGCLIDKMYMIEHIKRFKILPQL